MSGEQSLQELVTGMVASLANTHRQLDEISNRQAEALRDDVRLIKREILPAQSLRFDEFPYLRSVRAEQSAGTPSHDFSQRLAPGRPRRHRARAASCLRLHVVAGVPVVGMRALLGGALLLTG